MSTEANETSESRISKIEKLLAKANRAGTEAEAEAFFAKAQELMTKWAIDEAVLLSREGRGVGEEVVTEAMIIKRSGYHRSMVALAQAVAEANNVKVLWRSPSNWGASAGVTFIGFPSDIERTKLLYSSLLIQVTRERNRQTPDWLRSTANSQSEINNWRHAFSEGYAHRVGERLMETKKATEAAATESDGSLLPVLASREDEVQNFYDNLSKGKAVTRRRKVDWNGMSAGRSAADRADIGNARVAGNRGSLGR